MSDATSAPDTTVVKLRRHYERFPIPWHKGARLGTRWILGMDRVVQIAMVHNRQMLSEEECYGLDIDDYLHASEEPDRDYPQIAPSLDVDPVRMSVWVALNRKKWALGYDAEQVEAVAINPWQQLDDYWESRGKVGAT